MKYLKLFEMDNIAPLLDTSGSMRNFTIPKITREECEKIFTPLINWEMIKDIKDMSLEYIDEGCTLNIFILYKFQKIKSKENGRTLAIYKELFNHEFDQHIWNELMFSDNDFYLSNENVIYKFSLHRLNNWLNKEYTDEFISRISNAYPKENISLI